MPEKTQRRDKWTAKPTDVEGLSRNQTLLLPKKIEEYVTPDNTVRFIDAYVATLDVEKLGFAHSTLRILEARATNLLS